MKLPTRSLLALAVLAAGSGAVSAQQTLTFSNTDTNTTTPGLQPLTLSLLAGSTVSIAPSGNISAQCVLATTPPSLLCEGISTGGAGIAPVVSLAASAFSTTPNASNEYPAGSTNFTITPTVSGAEICVRSVTINGTAAQSTGWPATVALPFNPQIANLPTASSTYSFSIRCFGAGGATTATLTPPIVTSPIPPPGGCSGFTSNLPAGWSRGPLQAFNQVTAVEFAGQTWQPFPNAGVSGYVITNSTQFQSIGFTTPTDPVAWSNAAPNKTFAWIAAQQNGEAVLDKVYVSISSCAGDFRIPTIGSVAPAGDTTFARGCRNIRPAFGFPSQVLSNVRYAITTTNETSDDNNCRLAPGTPYFVNFIRADALDGTIGAPATEAICENGSSTCGVQMRVD